MKKYFASILIALFLVLASGTLSTRDALVFAATVDDKKKDDKKKDPPGPPPVVPKDREPKNDGNKPKKPGI
jgi:hypothetical protein